MSAKIYSIEEEVPTPKMDFANFNLKEHREAEAKYIADVKAYLLERTSGKNIGEVISFPVADSSAQYMVASMRPLALVHLPLGDAWDFQYAHLLTAKEVDLKIKQKKAMDKLFS